MRYQTSGVTAEEAGRVYLKAAKLRAGVPPTLAEVVAIFAGIGRYVSARTLRRWRSKNWQGNHEASPFSKALVAFTNLTDAFGMRLTHLVPGVSEIRPPTPEQGLDAYEKLLLEASAMTMAQLLETNSRMMLETSMVVQKIVHIHGVKLALENPTGLAQIINHLGKWNDHVYRSADAVVTLRERSMKLNHDPAPAVESSPTNVVKMIDYWTPAKPGESSQLKPDDPLYGA